jgi:hypothetical protein
MQAFGAFREEKKCVRQPTGLAYGDFRRGWV